MYVHRFTLNNLLKCSAALIRTSKLNLTSLGRNLSNTNKTRSNVKKVDRLLGNTSFQKESIFFYKLLSKFLISENSTSWIHVDWSCICSLTKLYLLRASISLSGRSIVVYEECHPKKNENNHAVHKNFLNNLKSILPCSTKPIIVTDAGFRALWFSYILQLGWDFVGRIRNKNSVLLDASSKWQLSSDFYEKATNVPVCIGHGILTESTKVPVNFVLYKGKSKNRHRNNKKNLIPMRMSERYSKAHKEPWLLATSLQGSKDLAIKTVNIYRQRMRIEENFRDTKCTRFGFGLKESRSRSRERMKILLLIAAVATFACWIAGINGKNTGIASGFQVQSAKFSRSLSCVYLGKEILKRKFRITKKQFLYALRLLFELVNLTQLEEHSYA